MRAETSAAAVQRSPFHYLSIAMTDLVSALCYIKTAEMFASSPSLNRQQQGNNKCSIIGGWLLLALAAFVGFLRFVWQPPQPTAQQLSDRKRPRRRLVAVVHDFLVGQAGCLGMVAIGAGIAGPRWLWEKDSSWSSSSFIGSYYGFLGVVPICLVYDGASIIGVLSKFVVHTSASVILSSLVQVLGFGVPLLYHAIAMNDSTTTSSTLVLASVFVFALGGAFVGPSHTRRLFGVRRADLYHLLLGSAALTLGCAFAAEEEVALLRWSVSHLLDEVPTCFSFG